MALFDEQLDFDHLYSLAVAQGLTAYVWDDVSRRLSSGELESGAISKKLKLRWALASESIVKRYHQQQALSQEFADRMLREGIRVYSLKGLSLSQYYPRPELRECGGFDCWVGDDFQRCNQLAAKMGADYDPYDYRHSVLNYRGLSIENHRYFLVLRGNARNKRLERYLLDIVQSDKRLADTNIFLPSSQFQAQFTILHMMHHFLYESIIVRHLLDYHYLVTAERDNVDWREFNTRCEEAGVEKFVAAVNHLCIQHFGLDISSTPLKSDGRYADKIWNDTINQSAIHSSGIENIWQQRYAKLRNVVQQRWKFNDVYDRNFITSILQTLAGMVFDRGVRF